MITHNKRTLNLVSIIEINHHGINNKMKTKNDNDNDKRTKLLYCILIQIKKYFFLHQLQRQ
jgi:hypothetical protein